jgi:lipopolysaccharide/colanic/teichoic acid biosynthesis glycosyltransferase
MLNLDLAYLERQSLLLDLWILLRTPYAVFFDRSAR